MANPQIENGYLKIANEIIEHLAKIRIPGEAMQILLVIIRQTYGFNKKEDNISVPQFVEKTGILRSHVYRNIELLKKMNIIKVTQKGTRSSRTYCFLKDYDKWKRIPKRVQCTNIGTERTKSGTKSVPKMGYTKDNIKTSTKNIVVEKKKTKKRFVPPTVEQVREYAHQINFDYLNPEKFISYYETKDWMVGKNKMKNWKAAIRYWQSQHKESNPKVLPYSIEDV